jgi:hypothetical protein
MMPTLGTYETHKGALGDSLKVYRTQNHILWLRGILNAIGLVTFWKSLDYITLSEGR